MNDPSEPSYQLEYPDPHGRGTIKGRVAPTATDHPDVLCTTWTLVRNDGTHQPLPAVTALNLLGAHLKQGG